MNPKTTLEQWQALKAVHESGNFADAAEMLSKSQSSVSYAIKQLQQQLPIAIVETHGRRTILTPAGLQLLQRASELLEQALRLERWAQSMAQGWEAKITLAVEGAFPQCIMMDAFKAFEQVNSQTHIELIESVLSGTDEALLNREVDMVIGARIPPGFVGEPLLAVEFVAVAHPDHPLHHQSHPLTYDDLKLHRQIVVRDSGLKRRQDVGWLGAEQRWTVTSSQTAILALKKGLGFKWCPLSLIEDELRSNQLKPLPLQQGQRRRHQLYLVYADHEAMGPGCRALSQLILQQTQQYTKKSHNNPL